MNTKEVRSGVDGLKRYEVFPYLDDDVAELDICESDDGTFVKYDDAKAIIDGLRGELGVVTKLYRESCDASYAYTQQAQRIGQLESLLRLAKKQLPAKAGLHMRIDAALSAGKEGS